MESLVANPGSNGGGLSRRSVLKAAGLGLSFLLPGLGWRAAQARGTERPKALITLWLAGGPSQLETWDPHPGTTIGGETRAIATRLAGLEIADLYPRMAEQIHELNVIRSLVSKEGDHERGTYLVKTGYRPDPTLVHPSLGAIVTHELPAEGVEIPRHMSIIGTAWPARGGFLGDDYDAFKIQDPQAKLQNMSARVAHDRQSRRLANLDVVESAFRRRRPHQSAATLHRETVDRAIAMMTSEQLRAFQVKEEPAEIRAAYGDSSFGVGCLVARRLVEVGVRAIEVNLNGFDTHAQNYEGQRTNAALLDPAFAALTHDLAQRDLLASTVVLCIGEFGRTPTINRLGGRDHWPTGFSCVVGGGGLAHGLVLGETDPTGSKTQPADPVEVQDLYATILQALGVDYAKELTTPIGRPMALCKGKPIARLLG
ncbi:MAG TPA: DUF1501 domain-containing protein [Planctomycetaceae bacterium]|jgi:uncharacterized protein (DUF1501 family)|nr:DUF1501 domain-containing protein [Planctomycetaceae bacterium]